MLNFLEALNLAAQFRFVNDRLANVENDRSDQLIAMKDGLYLEGLRVSEQTTPGLGRALNKVCERLQLPRDAAEAFVYASSELQAQCLSNGADECVLLYSSALIELLDEEEFSFVTGHEIGHFLLSHGNSHTGLTGLKLFRQKRAQEISADRMGLIACGTIAPAIRALMKSVSGLSSRHLSFDVGEFISQIDRVTVRANRRSAASSHPSMLIRSRALLWFSTSNAFANLPALVDKDSLVRIDEKVSRELDRDADGLLKEFADEAKTNLALWRATVQVVLSGAFTRDDQARFESVFGTAALLGLKGFLGSLDADAAIGAVRSKVEEVEQQLRKYTDQEVDVSEMVKRATKGA